jgi:hypothetical protein
VPRLSRFGQFQQSNGPAKCGEDKRSYKKKVKK